MRDYRNAKVMAQTLRDDLSAKSLTLSHSESLELVAHMLGLRDWNVLAAKIDTASQPVEAEPVQGAAAKPQICSFCRKTQHEVAKLIAGPDVFICDKCVGLCSDILVDENTNYAELTRDSLASKSVEELALLKARIGRSLSTAQKLREAIAPYIQSTASTTDAKPSPQAAFFLKKSPEERRTYVSEMERRIGAMERVIAIVSELLGKTARKNNDS